MWSTRKFKQHRVLKLQRRSWKKQLQVRWLSSEMEQIMHWNFRLPESGCFIIIIFACSYCMRNICSKFPGTHAYHHLLVSYCVSPVYLPYQFVCDMLHRHSLNYTVAIFHKVWHKLNFLHKNWVYLWSTVFIYTRGSSWNSRHQHTGTWSYAAWLPCCLCYWATVFFCQLHLIALSFLQGKMWHPFKKCCYFKPSPPL